MRIPMLRLDRQTLIVPLNADVHDEGVQTFQSELTDLICARQIMGVVIDVSALDVVDSYMARMLNDTASMVRLLGAEVVACGIQPAVALTLVEMGRQLLDVPTAFNLERALVLLRAQMRRAAAGQVASAADHDDPAH